MPNDLPQYLIGDKGVQLTATPLHTPDTGLLQGENVEFDRDGGLGGIASRKSLVELNATALAGEVKHIVNLPFPYPSVKVLMLALNAGEVASGRSWAESLDGATWTNISSSDLDAAVATAKFTANVSTNLTPVYFYMPQRTASYKRRIYFASDDYVVWYTGMVTTPTRPPIDQYDGGDGLELFRLPDNPTATAGSFPYWILGIWIFNGLMYLLTFDPGGTAPNHKGRVLTFDPQQGTIALVGNRFGDGTGENKRGMPYALASYQGRIFVCTMGIAGSGPEPGGRVYYILPGVDSTWTTDRTLTASGEFGMDLLPFQGNLYMAVNGAGAHTARVDVRNSAGAWATSFTAPGTNVSYMCGLIEFEDNLFAAYCNLNGAPKYGLIKKFNGTTWTTDKDVFTDYTLTAHVAGTPFVFEGNLYWPWYEAVNDSATTGFLLKRTSGGTWSQVLTSRGLRGAMGYYRDEVDPSPPPPSSSAFTSGFSNGFN